MWSPTRSIWQLGQLEDEQDAQKGFSTLKAAVAIVLGILLIFELPQGVFRALAKRKEK